MTVRIDRTDSISYVAKLYAKSREVRKERNVTGPEAKDELGETYERAQISEEARLLSLAREAFDRLPDVREDKVAYFRKKIESGEYKIDAEKLARILAKHLVRAERADDGD